MSAITSRRLYRYLTETGRLRKFRAGTCWFVRSNLAVTAWHCVEPSADYYEVEGVGQVEIADHDAEGDIALLRMPAVVVSSLPTLRTSIVRYSKWRAYGFPNERQGEGYTLTGRVSNYDATRATRPALQLLIDQGATAKWEGVSGSAIVVDDAVIGIVTSVMTHASSADGSTIDRLLRLLAKVDESVTPEEFRIEEEHPAQSAERARRAALPIVDQEEFPLDHPEALEIMRALMKKFPQDSDAFAFVESLRIDTSDIKRRREPTPRQVWTDILQYTSQTNQTRTLVDGFRKRAPETPRQTAELVNMLLNDTAVEPTAGADEAEINLERYLIALGRRFELAGGTGAAAVRTADAFVLPTITLHRNSITWPPEEWHEPVVLVGGPGSGKSMLLKHLAYRTAAAARDANAGAKGGLLNLRKRGLRVPVFVDLHEVAGYSADQIATHGLLPSLARDGITVDRMRRLIEDGDAMLLFDKFDELPTAHARSRLLEKILELRGGGMRPNAIIVASRERAWTRDLPGGFIQIRIEPLDDAQIEKFIGVHAHEAAPRILRALRASPRVRRIATNPQMLRMLILVLQEDTDRSLNHRVLVYEECVRRLITERHLRYSPAEVTDMLTRLALEMRRGNEPKLDLWRATELLRPFGHGDADVLGDLELDTGLVVVDGKRRVSFVHQTFQEYLAARKYALDDREREVLLSHVEDPTWSETLALAAGVLAAQRPDQLAGFLDTILQTPSVDFGGAIAPDRLVQWAPRVAAASVCFEDLQAWELDQRVLAPIKRAHALILPALQHQGIDLQQRIQIARSLGKVEDPRLADKELWVRFEEAMVVIGSNAKDAWPQERPPRRVPVQQLWIQRWPVVVHDFGRFIEDGGYTRMDWWDPEGLAWVQTLERRQPEQWEKQVVTNHPVTGVSYWEARAFCRWLTQQHALPDGWRIRLPRDAEWERVARAPNHLEDEAPRFSWGADWDGRAANSLEADQGLAPVGIFAPTPAHVWDLAGNVLEWCDDEFAPLGSPASERVVRGGSYLSEPNDLRVTVRNGFLPEARLPDLGFRCVATRMEPGK